MWLTFLSRRSLLNVEYLYVCGEHFVTGKYIICHKTFFYFFISHYCWKIFCTICNVEQLIILKMLLCSHTNFPANLCWSRHVLKTSSSRLQPNNFLSFKTSWRRLANTSWRRLEDISQARCLQDVLENEKLLRWRRLEDISWRRLKDMSWRHFGNKQNVYWGYLYLTMAY